tara:strand:+ start:491 stop:901 length:411 start_codon:yes stop_codon:yes gene_type:complete
MQTNNTEKNVLANSQHDMLLKIINGYSKISTDHEVTEALEQYLQSTENLGRISKISFAEHVDLSIRSITRKLKQDSTSYQQQLDLERTRRCTALIKNTPISGCALSTYLGFTSPVNFYSWFKKKYGATLTAFKKSR